MQLIVDQFASQAAVQDGLDVLATIRTATTGQRPGTLVLITSGLSTTAPIDVRTLAWDSDGVGLGENLFKRGWLDLSGWKLFIGGLGDVAGIQPVPNPPARASLARLWLGICQGAHAAACTDLGQLPGRAVPASTNHVPLVATPNATEIIELPNDAFFALDQSTLAKAADKVLQRVADRLRHSVLGVRIRGYTDASTGTSAHNLQLSGLRARAVADRLVQLGLDSYRILSVEGLGSEPFTRQEETADPALIQRHRLVRITLVPVSA